MSFHKQKNCRRGEELSFLANDSKMFLQSCLKKPEGRRIVIQHWIKGEDRKQAFQTCHFDVILFALYF